MTYLLAFTIYFAPAYALRFGAFGLPLNALLVWVALLFLIFFVWLLSKNALVDFLRYSISTNKILLIGIVVFALAGFASLFVGGFSFEKFGQFLVLFVQPIGLYFVARYIVAKDKTAKELIIQTLFVFAGLAGLFAITQYFTLYGLPQEFWGNSQEPKRAVGFFTHPNHYALFIAPVLALLIPRAVAAAELFFASLKTKRSHSSIRDSGLLVGAWVLGALGLLLSLSRGGWLAILMAAGLFVILNAKKKYVVSAIVVLVLITSTIYAIPNLRYRVLLPFYGEKSSVARLSLWHTGIKMIKDSPVLGKGLLGFTNNWYAYNTDQGLSKYPAPHNIFLNFWVDTGLLGLLSFVFISGYVIVRGFRERKNKMLLGLMLFIVAIFVHGLIDVPYLKNDLALLYWFVLGALL
jgi:O-antigen ligase